MSSVFIACCTRGFVRSEMVEGLVKEIETLMKNNIKFIFKVYRRRGIDNARNHAVKDFLSSNYEFLLFVDSDIVMDGQTILKLLMKKEKVVSAIARITPDLVNAFSKVKRSRKYRYGYKEYSLGEIVSLPRNSKNLILVDAVATACVLIHRDVFKKLRKPYFLGSNGEDLYFCRKLNKADIPIYIAFDVRVGHIKSRRYDLFDSAFIL